MLKLPSTLFLLALALPVMSSSAEQVVLQGHSKTLPSLTDLMSIERSISIFSSYARETTFSDRFSDASVNYTVLAPTNKAVISLPRKPHQGPHLEDMPEVSQAEYDAATKDNIHSWVGAHIIPVFVRLENDVEEYKTLLDGHLVKFRHKSTAETRWLEYVIDDEVHIVDKKEASNGVLYLVDGTSLY